MGEEREKIVQDSHPARYFAAQMRREQMPLRLPVIRIEGQALCCDMVRLELQGLPWRIMKEFVLRRGRLSHAVLLQLVERLATPAGSDMDRQAIKAITNLRLLCESSFANTYPQLRWLPSKGRSNTWLLLRLKESYVLAHMHERGRVANLFHRHKFYYDPAN